eukprot:TRINITY_DN25517_c0_g3_i1.p1 TRINITY_DN25517_c0_g3~~TRINITY_DN25517_c0_g3_i1.p1  ORF type:complete len:166 (-),score=38.07 TRINITY_DN25517_c0_g3_i1:114-611(-)
MCIRDRYQRRVHGRSMVDMFSITIDHGREVHNGSYRYMVALNCSSFNEFNAVVSSGRFSVISNSTQIQGIYDSKAKCAQMVIFDPQAEAEIDGMKISSSHTAVIRLQNIEANRWRLSVGAPTQNQNLKSITIHVNDKAFELDKSCLLYTSPSPRDLSTSRMPSSA